MDLYVQFVTDLFAWRFYMLSGYLWIKPNNAILGSQFSNCSAKFETELYMEFVIDLYVEFVTDSYV
jgi:hypothetical protein